MGWIFAIIFIYLFADLIGYETPEQAAKKAEKKKREQDAEWECLRKKNRLEYFNNMTEEQKNESQYINN